MTSPSTLMGCRMLTPGRTQVRLHPTVEPSFVPVHEDNAVGPAGPVALLGEQQAGQCAAQRDEACDGHREGPGVEDDDDPAPGPEQDERWG
ncbi:MAG: hypothetical protein ABT15_01425 [Pseudonocardia sp. SCN 73-27]|nr:MAG: hypothetical protein ABT15_01425 [Pseudonocardia sp. SCN 73-27]